MNLILRSTAAFCALSATFAWATPPPDEEHVGINAERGDPARWYVPANTPQLKYETQKKDARNALGEELKECRTTRGGAACVQEANAQYRSDMEYARRTFQLNSRNGPIIDR
jgi:hypothetical protein